MTLYTTNWQSYRLLQGKHEVISISDLLLLLALFVEVHDTKLASRFIPDLSINGITQETLSLHTTVTLKVCI